jgi:iron(III) transport system ATP-binding protein
MRIAIMKIQKEMNITTIYVTHDQEEALSMSDRIAVMNLGIVEQIGTPKEIYSKPATSFVAGFIGISNFLEGQITGESGESGFVVAIEGMKSIHVPLNKPVKGKVDIAIRPEDIYIEQSQDRGMNGTITLVTFLGDYISYEVQLDNGKLLEVNEYSKDTDQLRNIGDKVGLRFSANKINLYDPETKEAIR